MSTAIIGVGSIGSAVAAHLTDGGEPVVLAAHMSVKAEQLAVKLGSSASAASVADAIEQGDSVIFAVWLDTTKKLVAQHAARLAGKIVIDPSNPIAVGQEGQYSRTLPDDVSAVSQIAELLPPGASIVKAFGTLGAADLARSANRSPERVALFYATDDDRAASVIEHLIGVAAFDPVRVGGLDQAIRIEMFGDLHQFGGLNGQLLDKKGALAAVAGSRV